MWALLLLATTTAAQFSCDVGVRRDYVADTVVSLDSPLRMRLDFFTVDVAISNGGCVREAAFTAQRVVLPDGATSPPVPFTLSHVFVEQRDDGAVAAVTEYAPGGTPEVTRCVLSQCAALCVAIV
jgi:hypothetical protein